MAEEQAATEPTCEELIARGYRLHFCCRSCHETTALCCAGAGWLEDAEYYGDRGATERFYREDAETVAGRDVLASRVAELETVLREVLRLACDQTLSHAEVVRLSFAVADAALGDTEEETTEGAEDKRG